MSPNIKLNNPKINCKQKGSLCKQQFDTQFVSFIVLYFSILMWGGLQLFNTNYYVQNKWIILYKAVMGYSYQQ